MQSIKEWQRAAHALATEKGWWDDVPRDDLGRVEMTPDQILAKCMLIVTEAAEACECVRTGDMTAHGGAFVECPAEIATTRIVPAGGDVVHGQITKPEGFPIELADIVIRCFDLSAAMGIDLARAIEIKHRYNETRGYRHGGKAA